MSSTTEPTREEAIQQLIAGRAYEIWESQGRPNGYDVIHWLQAEQDVMSGLADDVAPTSGQQAGARDTAQASQAAA
jgi:hypothetical protein